MNTEIQRREWMRVAVYAALLLLIVSLPYALGWAQQGTDHVFSGFLYGIDDGNSYVAKMREGAQGHWDFSLVYTDEPHDSAPLVFLPYILPGQIVGRFVSADDPALTGVLIGVFHLMRIGFGALLIFVIYRFIAAFVEAPWMRMLALLLATLGGGLGWLLSGYDSAAGVLHPRRLHAANPARPAASGAGARGPVERPAAAPGR